MIRSLSPKAKTASLAGILALAMTGLGFAAVPLYDLFCRVTGFGGTNATTRSRLRPSPRS